MPAPGLIDLGAMRAKRADVTDAAPDVAPEPGAIGISLDLDINTDVTQHPPATA